MYLFDRTLESFLQKVLWKDMMSIRVFDNTKVIFGEGYVYSGEKVFRLHMREEAKYSVSGCSRGAVYFHLQNAVFADRQRVTGQLQFAIDQLAYGLGVIGHL